MQVLIELQDADGGRQRYSLSPGQYYMGKADTCAILLNDPHVSRHHATLEVSDTDVILTDNNSTNGTWFENQRILNPILVQSGDVLSMGTMRLTILEVQPEGPSSGLESVPLDEAQGAAEDDDGVWDDSPYSDRSVDEQPVQQEPGAESSFMGGSGSVGLEGHGADYDQPDYDQAHYDQVASDALQYMSDGVSQDHQNIDEHHLDPASDGDDDLTSQEVINTEHVSDDAAGVKYDPGLGFVPAEAPPYYDTSPAISSPSQAAQAVATVNPDDGLEAFWQSLSPEQQDQFLRQSADPTQQDTHTVSAGPAGGALKHETPEQRAARERAEQMVQSTNPVMMADMDDPEKAAFQQKVIATAQQMVARELSRIDEEVRRRASSAPVAKEVTSDSVGFGELQPLMDDPDISRIMINGLNGLFVERQGRLEQLKYSFEGQEALNKLVLKILAPLGLEPANLDPVLDTFLPDGTHLNIVFSPIATSGPLMTLQKSQTLDFEASRFLESGSCSAEMIQFLQQCVAHKRNIIVTGAANTGKSACLNMLTDLAHPRERVVIIEDVPELSVKLPHAIRLQAGLARLQGVQGLSTQLLMNNTFSMRPDRIVLGAFFPNAALDILMTMNNSSASFLSTFEAHSARDLMYRLELGVIMRKPELPIPVIRSQAAHAVNIIVTMAQFPDGSRKIAEVSEVFGIEEGRVGIQPVFRFLQGGQDEHGMDGMDGMVLGHYEATGYVPSFYRHKERVGEAMDKSIFQAS
jgi:pilus assembly protein CpaF